MAGKRAEAYIKRCAIYTRKSSAEGLERSINSLDAQRHFCESYIASQAGEGWTALDTRYDDGGFSGGTLERPAVKRLLADVTAGAVDTVVVYKIDRLSRSLIDFASVLGRFEAAKVSFVAVTQAFNTTSSMGRLTLNVLLSFAQFERELASERLRDKAAVSRAQGLWQGGPRPFGYRIEKGRLIVIDAEAEVVRHLFARYPVVKAVRLLAREITAQGVVNKTGRSFTATNTLRLLKNRLYCGDLTYSGKAVPGFHEAIIDEEAWEKVQCALESVYRVHRPLIRPFVPNPLRGRIFGSGGRPLSHTFCHNRGKVHRYYIPTGRQRYGTGDHYRAADVDAAILKAISPYVPAQSERGPDNDENATLNRLVSRVDLGEQEMIVTLVTGVVVRAWMAGQLR